MMRATFHGICFRCDGDIRPGDVIGLIRGRGEPVWVHARCAPGGDE